MPAGLGSRAFQAQAPDHDRCVAKHANLNVLLLVCIPAKFSRLHQGGKRAQVFIEPCRFVLQALTLVNAILPLQGVRGRPRHRPDCVLGDRGYDAEWIRRGLRDRGILPLLARRNTEHGSGLGRRRWVVERTFAWLNQFRRLRVRYEKRADIHEAFLVLGCILICWKFLTS